MCNYLRISVIIALLAMVFSACEKDDDNDPASYNPFNGKTTAAFNSSVTYGTMTDQDGNVYKTVTIGNQTWMAENLRTTKYNDGTAIPLVTDLSEWSDLSTGAYCNYDNTNNTDTIATFGRLYNWYAVNTGKLAPKGWHVPTDADWTTLTTYLGGKSVSGSKLKETGNTHWGYPYTGATNETGFTALPGGYRDCDNFYDVGYKSCWWSATEYVSDKAWFWHVHYNYGLVYRTNYYKEVGSSVRCVRN
jgi:uncharacterized protein (TIGR02145 family)